MSWPSPTEFNEAVQSPSSAFGDEELRRTQPATDTLGLVRPYAGNFADVYQLRGADNLCWAVKCFTRAVPNLHKRYQAISDHLQQGRLPFLVHFRYLAEGIRIGGQWYPIVKMPWIQGFTLNQFVRDNLDKPAHLDRLAKMWVKLAQQLRGVSTAHADLQHGNVLLVPGSKTTSLSLRLIDYDGMFVPTLAGRPSGEVGHPNYQHPQRLREATYNAEVDRFAHLVIYTALRCLALPEARVLWGRYDNSENLLFREQDFKAPLESKLFHELWRLQSPAIRALVGHLVLATQGPLLRVPLLDQLVADGITQPLTNTQEQQLRRTLGEDSATVSAPAALPVTPEMLLEPPAAVAVPVTPAMLLEPAKGVLVSVTDTVALQPAPKAPPLAIPVAAQPGRRNTATAAPALPRAIPVGQPAVNWKASLGPGAVVVAVIALGLLLMICISVVVMLMHPVGNANTPHNPPKQDPPDNTPVVHTEQQRLPWPHLVTCMTVSADGNWLITGSDEQHPRLRVYDLTDGKLKQSFLGPRQRIQAVAWSPRGDRVFAVADETIFFWDVSTGQLLGRLGRQGVCCVAVSPDGQWVLAGSQNQFIYFWPTYEPEKMRSFSQGKGVSSVAFLAKEGQAVTACTDGTLHFWDLPKGIMQKRSLPVHPGAAAGIVVTVDGKRVLAGDGAGIVRLWDVDTEQELKKLTSGSGTLGALALTPDGTLAAVARTVPGGAADVRVFNLTTGQALYRVAAGPGAVLGLAVLPERNALVTGGADRSLRLWPLRPGEVVRIPSEPTPQEPTVKDEVSYVKELAQLLEETAAATSKVKDRSSVMTARLELCLLAERWARLAAVPQPLLDSKSELFQQVLAQYQAAEKLREDEVSRLTPLLECHAALAVLNLHDGKLK